MSYVALYRKFRPPVWGDVRGQDHIVTTIRNQIKSDRVGHAYLFCGTRGTGKTSVAKIMARAVNCEDLKDESPCGECASCRAIASETSLNVIEIDAASNNGVDNVRTIVEEVQYPPTSGRYKVYIIDEVHMLSTSAFNALLKTLEEPPEYVLFILATTEVQKLPITILSRCQRYDFHRITADVIAERMNEVITSEEIKAEERAIRYIAGAADGSMRDGLSLLDQCLAFRQGDVLTYERTLEVLGAVDTEVYASLFAMLTDSDASGVLSLIQEVTAKGCDPVQFTNDFVWYLRNLMLAQSVSSEEEAEKLSDIIDVSPEHYDRLKELADAAPAETVMRYIRIFSELSGSLRYASQKRVLLEMTMIRACKPQSEDTGASSEAIEERLKLLEDREARAEKTMALMAAGGIAVNAVAKEEAPAEEAKEEEQKPGKKRGLERAVPEEIRAVIDRWDYYVSMMSKPTKTFMSMHPRPRPSVSDEGKLVIAVFNRMHADYMKQPEQRAELEAMFAEQTGRKVEVEIDALQNEEDFDDKYPDLTNMIRQEIETEDFSEEDF